MAAPARAHLVAPQPLVTVVKADLEGDLATLTARVATLEAQMAWFEARSIRVQSYRLWQWLTQQVGWLGVLLRTVQQRL